MSNERTAVKQTLAAYCHLVDRGSAVEVAGLFAEDAILKPYFDDEYDVVGRQEVERWYAHYHDNFRANVRHLKHMIMSALIEVDGDIARSSSYLLASFVNNETDEGAFAIGTYTDNLVKVGDMWQFEIRQIDVDCMMPQGKVVEEFPSLDFPRD